jgi:hypothetical protein
MSGWALLTLEGAWSVVRLDPAAEIPEWALAARPFVTITRTSDELSIVCPTAARPAEARSEDGWAMLRLRGDVPFTTVGVIEALARPLAEAGIGIFVVSTFDTDYLLVKRERLHAAVAALRAAGHRVEP